MFDPHLSQKIGYQTFHKHKMIFKLLRIHDVKICPKVKQEKQFANYMNSYDLIMQ